MDEKFLLVSIEDPKLKKLSEVLSNRSCKKILSVLSTNESTETELSKVLKMPINTIDYNVKKLIDTGLIEKTTHFWSIRGKKMPRYKVSNRKIIISPKESKIQELAAVTVVGLISTVSIYLFNRPLEVSDSSQVLLMEKAVTESYIGSTALASINPAWWFLGGFILSLILFVFLKKMKGGPNGKRN